MHANRRSGRSRYLPMGLAAAVLMVVMRARWRPVARRGRELVHVWRAGRLPGPASHARRSSFASATRTSRNAIPAISRRTGHTGVILAGEVRQLAAGVVPSAW